MSYTPMTMKERELKGEIEADVYAFKQLRLKEIRQNPSILGEDYVNRLDKLEAARLGEYKNYCHIVIGFPDDWSKDEIMEFHIEKFDKLIEKKWVKEFYANYEFVSEDGTWSHPHLHLFCTRQGKCKSDLIKETYNTVKKYIHGVEAVHVSLVPAKDFKKQVKYNQKNRLADRWMRHLTGLHENYTDTNPCGTKIKKDDLGNIPCNEDWYIYASHLGRPDRKKGDDKYARIRLMEVDDEWAMR